MKLVLNNIPDEIKKLFILKGGNFDNFGKPINERGKEVEIRTPSDLKYHHKFVEMYRDILKKVSFAKDMETYNKWNLFGKLSQILAIVQIENGNLNEKTFFEFGSRHTSYDFGLLYPHSSSSSWYMILDSNLDYFCFDPASNKNYFKKALPLINYIINNEHERPKSYGDFKSASEWRKKIKEDVENVNNLIHDETLGLDMYFHAVSSGWGEEFYHYFKSVNFETLIEKLKTQSIDHYEGIVKQIEITDKPVIYSKSVLNENKEQSTDDGLDLKFPFWEIDKGFHVHSGSHIEMLVKLGMKKNIHFGTNDYLYEITERELNKFKEVFNVKHEVKAFLDEHGTAFYFWNTR